MSQYYDVILTDIQLHAQTPTKPRSLVRSILRSIRSNKPGRAFSTGGEVNPDGTVQFSIPLESLGGNEIEQARRQGKQIRIFVPKSGLNIKLSKDAIEKHAALKRQGKI